MLGETGQHECPNGYETINFPNTCKLASETVGLGLGYHEEENDHREESICFLGGMSFPQTTKVSNQYSTFDKLLCQREGFATGMVN